MNDRFMKSNNLLTKKKKSATEKRENKVIQAVSIYLFGFFDLKMLCLEKDNIILKHLHTAFAFELT